MPKICYTKKNFNEHSRALIVMAEKIIDEYFSQGYKLTLRQLYYQFVARNLIPNSERSYKNLGNLISDARRAGLFDWSALEDRTRRLHKLAFWNNPKELLETARDQYHRDLWANQKIRIQVWIEKDALLGVISEICEKNDVPYFSCRGYASDSEIWNSAMRLRIYVRDQNQEQLVVLYLGDHDPSGLDMTRDIEERLRLFSVCQSEELKVKRIALTMDQIKQLKPPPNPAKITDSRYRQYVSQYGNESWELDVLEPKFIEGLIHLEITKIRNLGKWQAALLQEERERKQIDRLIKNKM